MSKVFNYEQDSFLNYNYFLKLRKDVKNCFHGVDQLGPIHKLKKMNNQFKFIKSFETKSVQGIAGILEAKHVKNYPVVFKTSIEIDRIVEHENDIIESLNGLRQYCPHFVSSFGMHEFPISRTFIYTTSKKNLSDDELSDSESESDSDYHSGLEDQSDYSDEEYTIDDVELFMTDENYLPSNVLFLEYVSTLTFDKLTRYSNKDLINSQILGVMAALYIAQSYLNFTHYDLHIDNVLIRQCEPEAIFAYTINGYSFLVPTFGFYPVIIDMGSSYSKALEGKTLRTTVGNYDNGLQPSVFDQLNDLHHFLLSSLYSIEYECEEFYFISTRFLYFFKHIPVLRKNGWKKLPNEIVKLSIKFINKACQDMKINYKMIKKKHQIDDGVPRIGINVLPVWYDLDRDLVEIFSCGIKLPWSDKLEQELVDIVKSDNVVTSEEKEMSEEEVLQEAIRHSFLNFFTQFQKFDDLDRFDDPNDLLFMLRELVQLVVENWNDIKQKMTKIQSKNLLVQYKRRIIPDFKDLPFGLDWNELIVNCKWIISILGVLFNKFVEPHKKIIEEAYHKTQIKGPLDLIKWFKQNATMRPVYSKDTILYVWNADEKKSKRVKLVDLMNEEDIPSLNREKRLKAEQIVINKIK